MIQIIFMILVISAAVIKLINYGRWAGRQRNLRGMLGLYLIALSTFLFPIGVYILNATR